MQRIYFRFFLLAGAAIYITVLSVHFVGAWFASLPITDNVARGLRWTPGNPELWTDKARSQVFSMRGLESSQAPDTFLRAAHLNPFDPVNWDGLVTAELQNLEPNKAEAVFQAWLKTLPYSPVASWRFGNFLIVQGRLQEAFPYLKSAAAASPKLHYPLYDLAWKVVADPEVILHDLVPATSDGYNDYLAYLVQIHGIGPTDNFDNVWEKVRNIHSKRSVSVGYIYAYAVASVGLGPEASKVWTDLLADTGRTSAKPAGELLTNGDFEAGLPDVGLDWRLVPGPGYKIELDDSVAQSGSYSLRVIFDGTANPDFAGVWQFATVEPNRSYRLRAYVKTEDVTTDSGIRFQVSAVKGSPGETFFSKDLLGTNPWSLEQLDFRTGPQTQVVQVYLRRLPSNKLMNVISGKVWIDNLSLRSLPQ